MLDTFKRLLQSEVTNGSKSERTVQEYIGVARKLANGDYTDENIPSKPRWRQISAVLSYLKDYELISEAENFGLHPKALKRRFKGEKSRNEKVEVIKEKVVTAAQFSEILAALPTTSQGDELRVVCELSRFSGMRMSEVLSLTLEMIECKEDAIYLKIIGKRRKPRIVYLPIRFAAKFENFEGFQITQNYVACTYRRITRKLGIMTSFHALRHTYATECTEHGMDFWVLAGLLGHSDPKTTMIYVHMKQECPQDLLAVWDVIER